MEFYQLFYGYKERGDAKPEVRPKGLRLLGYLLRNKWWELIKLNIVFWAACLPLVTIPAALKAMSRVEIQYLRGEPISLWMEFVDSFKEKFLRTTLIGALTALLLAALFHGVSYYGAAMAQNGLLALPAVIMLVAALTAVMMCFSLFPLLAFSDLKLGDLLRSSLLLTMARLPQNLAALGVLFLLAVAYVLLFPYSTFVLAGFALAFAWLVVCFAAWPGLSKHVFHMEE